MSGRYLIIFCCANFIGLATLLFLHFSDKQDRIVYIDSARIINSYQGMITARKEYQQKISVWKANIDTLAKEVQHLVDKHQSTSARMTAREKDLSKQLIQAKQQQLTEYQRVINEKASQEDASATKKVMDEINAYVKAYGEEHHYSIVLAATEQGNVAFAEKHLDITDVVLDGLNKKYAGQPVK